ncbi:nf-kappa b activating protein [Anaeramoeba flamelloides]|uniref:Nf-kappa b activating protein n=1 Tax=Anaeramoeba flamelloides TaxID=1746091 RepID=A0ABQ8YP12_9EUKA|nr:nf-kappa b activating protein [Anaeramoeba flamelloides]
MMNFDMKMLASLQTNFSQQKPKSFNKRQRVEERRSQYGRSKLWTPLDVEKEEEKYQKFKKRQEEKMRLAQEQDEKLQKELEESKLSDQDNEDEEEAKNEIKKKNKPKSHHKKEKKKHKKNKHSKKKSKHKKNKHKKEKEKKKKKSKKNKKQVWVEKTINFEDLKNNQLSQELPDITNEQNEKEFLGPTPLQSISVSYGDNLMPGEGEAYANFVKQNKRIPRRGEIGLTSEEIERFEKAGYVMSGSRHKMMNAVRLRKESQIYSAEEKRALAMLNLEEQKKRETEVLNSLKDLVKKKLKKGRK